MAYQKANAIKRDHLRDDGEEVVNTFQWIKAKLNLEFPAALSEIKRHESDSKFFRSLVVVFFLIGILQLSKGAWVNGLGCLIFDCLSFWRYFDQRWKSTQIACTHLIAMEDLGPDKIEKTNTVG